MRWALLRADGYLLEGDGRPAGVDLGAVARTARAGVFTLPARGPSIYVAGGPDLLWTVERAVGSDAHVQTFWSFGVPPGARVWVSPRGMIGIGRSVEEVEGAFRLLVEAAQRLGGSPAGG